MTVSKVVHPPQEQTPYWVGIVAFGKKKVVGQILAEKDPKIGDRVVGVIRRLCVPDETGIIEYGVKFKIID